MSPRPRPPAPCRPPDACTLETEADVVSALPNEATATRITREDVEAVLEEHVLPYVRNHGGDVLIDGIDADGAVTCRLEGACRGCPAAPVTAVAVIERALRAHLGAGIAVRTPQLAVSSAALARIRSFYPERVTASQRKSR